MHTSVPQEVEYRLKLETFFHKSAGSNVEKLQNFAKYVPRQNIASFLFRYELFKKVLPLHGSIIECGSYLGGGLMSFAKLSTILEPYNYQRQVVGFDTFSGFPDISQKDKQSGGKEKNRGDLAVTSQEYLELLEAIALYDMNRFLNHMPKATVVKGDIQRTLPKYLKGNPHTLISLLYLDLDLYEPTKLAIRMALPHMSKGAIIAFDELNSAKWPGETVAVREAIGLRNLHIERFPFDPARSFAILD